ncbi:MAG: hypothetical protein ACFFA4_01660 [Promethearchaeota archaeon]
MVKKTKYKLFSYLIENNLIYYKSLKENSKIIAFTILECQNYKLLDSVLNKLLIRRIIQYYSIQIDTNDKNRILIILNFEESKKENIIKNFNMLKQTLEENYNKIKILREKVLEERFLSIIFQNLSSNPTITKSLDSIVISTENKSNVLDFFIIDFDLIEKKKLFISNFLNLISNIGQEGYLIFNFKMDNRDNIRISPYFVLKSDDVNTPPDIEKKVNNFFHSNLLKRENIKIKTFSNFLWRLGINNIFFFYNNYFDLFYSNIPSDFHNLLEMNKNFEENLLNNQIEYIRLSKNLIVIEQSYLFLILEKLDCNYIYKIIEKYHPKYFIYILILNYLGNMELQKIKSIKLIEKLKVINAKEIQNFNFKEFRRNIN